MKKMDFDSFKVRIEKLPNVVYSISEKRIPYYICSLQGDVLTMQRGSTKGFVTLSVKELYDYYTKESIYNTRTARNHISGYVYSPAAAVINELIKSLKEKS